jgi:hypothetical protein
MATENKSTPVIPKGPSLSDTNARDSFIAVALREIIAWQLSEGKVNHDQAGVLAVRYGNSTMAARGSESGPLKVVVAKGVLDALAPPIELSPGLPFDAPQSIEEIIKGEEVDEAGNPKLAKAV